MDCANQPLLKNRIKNVVDDIRKNFGDDDDSSPSALIFLRHVRPVAQNGPQCGLVALHMASDMLPSPVTQFSVDAIFELAKSMGYTNHGEMFSVQWLANLAATIYQTYPVKVISIDQLSISPTSFVIRTLLDYKSLLIPYDTDKNHEPTLNGGHTAHWALIIGFMIVDTSRSIIAECPFLDIDAEDQNLHWFTPRCLSDHDRTLILSNLDSSHQLYVLALHGKSKHAAVWPLEKLLVSNRNLREIGAKRLSDGLSYVVPPEGVQGGLCGKVLVLG